MKNQLTLFLLAGAAVVSTERGASAQVTSQNAAEAPFATWLTNFGAQGTGYQVIQGKAVAFPSPCNDSNTLAANYITYLGSCFGNNAATPYILDSVPPPPSGVTNGLPSYVPLYFHDAPIGAAPVAYEFYQLNTNEAVVTVITLPPKAAYYGFQSYEFERQNLTSYVSQSGIAAPTGTTCTAGAPWPSGTNPMYHLTADCKYNQFAFFGNAVNDVDILVQSQFSSQFNVDPTSSSANVIAIVTTPSSDVFNALKTALISTPSLTPGQYLSVNQIFLDQVPASSPPAHPTQPPLIIGGTGTGSDVLASIFRYTLPQDSTQSVSSPTYNWVQGPQTNILVARVEYPTSMVTAANNYYFTPAPSMTQSILPQGNNTIETANATNACVAPGTIPSPTYQSYYCDIQELQYELKQYMVATNNTGTFTLMPTSGNAVGGTGPSGPIAIVSGSAIAGATQDTDAYFNANIGAIPYSGIAFALGVNHSTSSDSMAPTNNAYYTGIGLAQVMHNEGVADIVEPNFSAAFSLTSMPTAPTNYLYNSGVYVVNRLRLANNAGYSVTAPSTALTTDAPNLYVGVYQRLPQTGAPCSNTQGTSSTMAFYCNSSSTLPFIYYVNSLSTSPIYLDPTQPAQLTERGYVLPPLNPTATPTVPSSGANAANMQPPYILVGVLTPHS